MGEAELEVQGVEVRIHLPRDFTPGVAVALHRLVARAPPGSVLDLDFSGVRDCQDQALLLLARDLLTGTARYAFHGLTHHQRTMLGYLGAQLLPAPELEFN